MPRKTKLGTEVAHVTPDSDTTLKSKGQKSTSTGRFAHRRVGASGGCSGGRVRMCWPWETAATLPSARRSKRVGTHGEERGGDIVAAALLQLVELLCLISGALSDAFV